jgi:hypothetical protein
MWTALLTVAVQLVGWFLKKGTVKDEFAKEFYAWAERLGTDLGATKLREYGFKQQEWLRANPWQETK